MKAYAVLSGGGVKGAALAGCLAAAEERDIQWAGCAGTSAGALVAALASVGFGGAAIAEKLKTTLHPRALIDDRGARLDELVKLRARMRALVTGDLIARGRALLACSRNAMLGAIGAHYGVYDGAYLEQAIRSIVRSGPLVSGKPSDTFHDLTDAACPQLGDDVDEDVEPLLLLEPSDDADDRRAGVPQNGSRVAAHERQRIGEDGDPVARDAVAHDTVVERRGR